MCSEDAGENIPTLMRLICQELLRILIFIRREHCAFFSRRLFCCAGNRLVPPSFLCAFALQHRTQCKVIGTKDQEYLDISVHLNLESR